FRAFARPVDVIVTTPPFGSDLADRRALSAFELGQGRTSRRRGVLFLERCLELLKPGGVLAIVLDDSVLNGPSNTDAPQMVLDRARPVAVVRLPGTAFLPYASVKASVLFLQKNGGRKRSLVRERGTFFAQAESVGRKANGEGLVRLNTTTNRMEVDSDLPEILRRWRNDRSGEAADERVF